MNESYMLYSYILAAIAAYNDHAIFYSKECGYTNSYISYIGVRLCAKNKSET